MKPSFNISKHILVPKHKKLSEAEKKQLLEHFHITENELPKLLIKDPAVIDLKLKPRDVVKITRKSSTAGESYYYRCAING
ncbi:MAG: DNA-directed RNA polymerase subunit H [Candidatus Woesearchaeota archaeon]